MSRRWRRPTSSTSRAIAPSAILLRLGDRMWAWTADGRIRANLNAGSQCASEAAMIQGCRKASVTEGRRLGSLLRSKPIISRPAGEMLFQQGKARYSSMLSSAMRGDGKCPMKMTCSTTPRDQTSIRSASAGRVLPTKASGAMYSAVPIFGVTRAPATVVPESVSRRERPKSISFIGAEAGGRGSRSGSRCKNRKFSGFRSR
mmetsp:Transcript_79859/g.231797  ORF Transcript_79859/g.231797 Transcript_79859/m.231797 type:complete len:202 (+) Transcript_79859:499-1104(+)